MPEWWWTALHRCISGGLSKKRKKEHTSSPPHKNKEPTDAFEHLDKGGQIFNIVVWAIQKRAEDSYIDTEILKPFQERKTYNVQG